MEQEKPKLKPLHKSLVFWAGLLVTLFLIWIWVDSRSHRTQVGWTAPPRMVALVFLDSKVMVAVSLPQVDVPAPSEWIGERSRETRSHDPANSMGIWFQTFQMNRIAKYSSGVLYFDGTDYFVPMWFVLLAWLFVWLFIYRAWRSWQRSRIAKRKGAISKV